MSLHRFGRGVRHVRGTMNRSESAYQLYLEAQKRAGRIEWYGFEAIKLRLADNTYYIPDFAVMRDDGVIELHDVKGAKGDAYWCEEDAKMKIKIAAEAFPFRFVIVWCPRNGGWRSEIFGHEEKQETV